MPLQATITYQYKGQDVVLVNGQLRLAANPAVFVVNHQDVKRGELTLGGTAVEPPRRTVDDFH